MSKILISWYDNLVLKRPLLVLALVIGLVGLSGYFAQFFTLDASGDSLVLETDEDLRYYRALRGRYGSDEFLFITYSPREDMFSDAVLDDLRKLKSELTGLERVKNVVSILDVPLLDSPRVNYRQLQKETRTLESEGVDRELVRKEFTSSRLYKNLIMSPDGTTTTLQVNFKRDDKYQQLLAQRETLRGKSFEATLSKDDQSALDKVSTQFRRYSDSLQDQQQADIGKVRGILDRHKSVAEIHLGGVPMITSDMVDFVRSDINVFGAGVAVMLVLLLSIGFQRLRWVLVPMLICITAGIVVVGFLGLMDWRVTVVSSNFISLMLILTLSLIVHLVVRYEEVHHLDPDAPHLDKLRDSIHFKFLPSLFTSLTTMVAFASLVFSDIRPVIDFGWMMVIGVGMAFVLVFLMFPAQLALLKPARPVFSGEDVTATITRRMAVVVERFGKPTLALYALILVLSISGIFRLTVENSFIDYFKKSTEIYQGMLLIDRKVGGTTPLDVIIDAPKAFHEDLAAFAAEAEEDGFGDAEAGLTGDSYWFNVFELETVSGIHQYLDGLPATGKVISLDTTMALLTQLNNDKPIDNLTLSVIYKRLPPEIKASLISPYLSEDGNQLRFAIRILDSEPGLQRDLLIKQIREDLVQKFDLEPGQVRLSGMLVLYNNVLQSLFRSQILTLAVVFIAITIMFGFLFKSVRMALIGIVPTLIAASLILGLMGWFSIPLDIMTITIAAITVGIGVDNTIHYVHRMREEFASHGDYWQAIRNSHGSVGRAIYYTSVTITLGFSILALSNFIPTIYFGLLTGLAMVVALLANLTLLPLLMLLFKPLGQDSS